MNSQNDSEVYFREHSFYVWINKGLKMVMLCLKSHSWHVTEIASWIRILTSGPEFIPWHQNNRYALISRLSSSHSFCCHHIVPWVAVVESMGNNYEVSLGEKTKMFLGILKLWWSFLEYAHGLTSPFPHAQRAPFALTETVRSTLQHLFCWEYEQLSSNALSDPELRSLCVLVLLFSHERIVVLEVLGGGMLVRHVIPKSFLLCPAIWFLCCPPMVPGPWVFSLGPAVVTASVETGRWLPCSAVSGCELLSNSVNK